MMSELMSTPRHLIDVHIIARGMSQGRVVVVALLTIGGGWRAESA